MSARPTTSTADTPLAGYAVPAGCVDEMIGPDGRVREHWARLAQSLEELGPVELARREREASRLLEEDGVTYHAYGSALRGAQRWGLDPVPVLLSSQEWADIEAGVIERAELLNLVLDDLYGARDLIDRGVLPPEAVFGHAGFLRPCDRIRLPGSQQLFSYGVDLVRGADGGWQVLSDRTQTPSGFGYALENRTVMSRVFPSLYRDAHVHRLAPFFRSLRSALQDAAPRHGRRSADRRAHTRPLQRDRVRARVPRLASRLPARRRLRSHRARRAGVDARPRPPRAGPRDPAAGGRVVLRSARAQAGFAPRRRRPPRGVPPRHGVGRQHDRQRCSGEPGVARPPSRDQRAPPRPAAAPPVAADMVVRRRRRPALCARPSRRARAQAHRSGPGDGHGLRVGAERRRHDRAPRPHRGAPLRVGRAGAGDAGGDAQPGERRARAQEGRAARVRGGTP